MTTNNLLTGADYLLEGLKLIFKPGLKRFVIIPLIINIVLFVGLFVVSRHYFSEFNLWVEHHLPHWLYWLGSILWVLFFISFLLVMLYTFVTLANLIGAPFNSLLSEKIELYLTGNKINQKSWGEICKDTPRIIGRQLSLIGYYLPRAAGILILFFVPVVQVFAAIIWFLFNAWYMSLQYVDYPTDNHDISLKRVKEWLQQRRWTSLGFGGAVMVMSMIPVVNFFVVPAAVAGATKFFVDGK
jgi:CysZ protein